MSRNGKLWGVIFSTKALTALVVAVALWTQFNVGQFHSVFASWPPEGKPTLASRFSTWDVAHYLRLSQFGYKAHAPSCAFYPLWPAAVHLGAGLTGGRPVLGAMLLTNALSLLAFWLLYRLIERHCGPEVSRDSLILMLAFPSALFFSFPYSESIFLVLVLLFFWGLELERWAWVAIAGFLLPLTRPTGVFILAPLVWWLWERQKKAGRKKNAVAGLAVHEATTNIDEAANCYTTPPRHPRNPSRHPPTTCSFAQAGHWRGLAPWLLLLCPLLGYAAYFGLMHLWTGNAFEGFAAEKFYPNSPSIANMFNTSGFTNALLNIHSMDEMLDGAMDRAFFLLFLALLWPIYRLNKVWFFYVLPAGLVPALSNWFTSYRRYIMVLFPMFVVL
ncbi:MAG: hypothetical protein M1541_16355, partial [Acidobacteria bacterium]|nr:hypothetical protein [Acidobacteriota bacterium]